MISANDGNGNCDDPYDENCVNKDVADNTNLCFADLSQGEASSHFTSDGFAVFPEDNDNGEGAIHCHGFAWADDEYETTSRYRSNNLFFVSMYDHMYQRGYVKNIPGMPVSCCCLLLFDTGQQTHLISFASSYTSSYNTDVWMHGPDAHRYPI